MIDLPRPLMSMLVLTGMLHSGSARSYARTAIVSHSATMRPLGAGMWFREAGSRVLEVLLKPPYAEPMSPEAAVEVLAKGSSFRNARMWALLPWRFHDRPACWSEGSPLPELMRSGRLSSPGTVCLPRICSSLLHAVPRPQAHVSLEQDHCLLLDSDSLPRPPF
jgi:hypothetical protein